MAVLDAQGATLTIKNAVGTDIPIGGLVSFSGFDGEASDIDITTLASSAMEFRQGLQDFGNFSIELMTDPDDVGQTELKTAKSTLATREFILTLRSGHRFTFNAYVKSFTLTGAVNEVATSSVNMKVTGDVVES